MPKPIATLAALRDALAEAATLHHEYEENVLSGAFDTRWPAFYAAFLLGEFGAIMRPSELANLLEDTPTQNWTRDAAERVYAGMDNPFKQPY